MKRNMFIFLFIIKFDGGAMIGHLFLYFVSSFPTPHILINPTFGALNHVDHITFVVRQLASCLILKD